MSALHKDTWQGMLLVLIVGGVAAVTATFYAGGSADSPMQDIQPIDFRHRLHAGQLDIACSFCHRHADHSPTAGIPSLHLCMTCHDAITTPKTLELQQYWKAQQPIHWIRMQRLPDHVYFPHDMHLWNGLECRDCHGLVEQIDHTPRAPSFEMGWCLTCHQQRGASQDCWTCHK